MRLYDVTLFSHSLRDRLFSMCLDAALNQQPSWLQRDGRCLQAVQHEAHTQQVHTDTTMLGHAFDRPFGLEGYTCSQAFSWLSTDIVQDKHACTIYS